MWSTAPLSNSPTFNNSNIPICLEMVLMDDKGCKIHDTIRKSLISRFQHLLTEGNVYGFKTFGVGLNGGNFRTDRHQYKLNFQWNTAVDVVGMPSIDISPFSFVSFADILNQDFDQSFLVDVIGVMTGVSNEKEFMKEGKKIRMRILELENDGLKLECALFGTCMDQLNVFLDAGKVVNTVVIIQFAKVKTYKDVPESVDFIRRLEETNEGGPQVLSQLNDSQRNCLEDDFLNVSRKKTIEDLKDCKEDGFWVVMGTINNIQHDDNWWYSAYKCNKSVSTLTKCFFCPNCKRNVFTVYPRYRIKVRVIDQTNSATFVIFYYEAIILLKKKCFDITEKSIDDSTLLDEIMKLVNKTLLFKVETKNFVDSWFPPSFRVQRLTEDPSIIEKFKQLGEDKVEFSFSVPSIIANKDFAHIVDPSTLPSKNLLQYFSKNTGEKDSSNASDKSTDKFAVDLQDDSLSLTLMEKKLKMSVSDVDVEHSSNNINLKIIKKEKD